MRPMPTGYADRVVPGRSEPGRVRLLGIDERSSGVDPVLARIFATMRATLGLSEGELALRLATSPQTILILEAGHVRALPPWPETVRLVSAYARLLAIDARPILQRLDAQLGIDPARRNIAATRPLPTSPAAHAPVRAPIPSAMPLARQPHFPGPAEADKLLLRLAALESSRPRRRLSLSDLKKLVPSWFGGKAAAFALAMTVAGIGATTVVQSGAPMIYAAVDRLPAGLANGLQRRLDKHLTKNQGSADLQWIQAADPRRRKSDRLDTTTAAR